MVQLARRRVRTRSHEAFWEASSRLPRAPKLNLRFSDSDCEAVALLSDTRDSPISVIQIMGLVSSAEETDPAQPWSAVEEQVTLASSRLLRLFLYRISRVDSQDMSMQ